jgi:hypothetical protein
MDVSGSVAAAAACTAAQAVAAHPTETGPVVAGSAAADSSTADDDVSGQHCTCQNAYYCFKGMWLDLDTVVMRQANSNPE